MVIDNNDIPKQDYMVLCSTITYNHAPYITDTMNGFCMQQTSFSYACYIIDDASTDGEQDVIKAYLDEHFQMDKAEQYELELANVIVAKHNTNPNCTFAVYLLKRNLWKEPDLKRPLGRPWTQRCKYIALCEGDDYWTDPLKLQKQVDFMEANPEYGLCYTDYNRLEDAIQTLTESMFEQQNQYRPISYEQHLLKPGYLAPMTWLYRHELMNLIDKANVHTDGTYAYMLEFLYNSKVAYIPQVTAVYRSHAGSASSPIGDKALFRYTIGVFRTQIHYTQKYSCSNELKHKVLMRGYLCKLPIAIMAENEDFVREAKTFMEAQDIDIDLIIRELKQGEMKRKSYAYRLGKKLLKPISWLRNIRK